MSASTIDHDYLRDSLADGLQRLSGKAWIRADDGSIRSEGSMVALVVLELTERQGRLATHLGSDDPDGLPGMHVLHGVKLLFGGRAGEEVAEVRVDSVCDEASSRALADVPWPRLEKPAFARA